jgi:hypothetical protein
MVRQYGRALSPAILDAFRSLPWWARYKPARILYMDDFEGALKWLASGTVAKDTGVDTFEGSAQLKLTTTASAGNYSSASQIIGQAAKGQIQLQLRWHLNAAAELNPRYVQFGLDWYDGTNLNSFPFRYLKNTSGALNKWQYLGSDNAYHDIPGGGQVIPCTFVSHNFLRVRVDMRSGSPVYSLLESNDVSVNMKGTAGYQTASSNPLYTQCSLIVCTDLAYVSSMGVDALLLSDMEP